MAWSLASIERGAAVVGAVARGLWEGWRSRRADDTPVIGKRGKDLLHIDEQIDSATTRFKVKDAKGPDDES
jgi:hypothetical protein